MDWKTPKSPLLLSAVKLLLSSLLPLKTKAKSVKNVKKRMEFVSICSLLCLLAMSNAWQASPSVSTRSTASPLFMASKAEYAPPLAQYPPRRVFLMVEPTPFTHVSGYANRFQEMLKFLSKAGDNVDILTVDSKTPSENLPSTFCDFKIEHTQGFTFPLYNQISLSFDLPEMKGSTMIQNKTPDLIHVTSP